MTKDSERKMLTFERSRKTKRIGCSGKVTSEELCGWKGNLANPLDEVTEEIATVWNTQNEW